MGTKSRVKEIFYVCIYVYICIYIYTYIHIYTMYIHTEKVTILIGTILI